MARLWLYDFSPTTLPDLTCFGRFWSKEKEPNMAANSLIRRPKEPTDGLIDSQSRPNGTRIMQRLEVSFKISFFLSVVILALANLSCAPRITSVTPLEGAPATTITVSMEYLVGWPRVEISDKVLEWPQLKLIAASPERRDVPGEELVWIEDKFLQFTIPDISPGEYVV